MTFSSEELLKVIKFMRSGLEGQNFQDRLNSFLTQLKPLVPFSAATVFCFSLDQIQPSQTRGLVRYQYTDDPHAGLSIEHNFRGLESYLLDYANVDPTAESCLAAAGSAVRFTELLPDQKWGRDPISSDFFGARGIRYAVSAIPQLSEKTGLSFGFYREEALGEYGDKELEILNLLVPEIILALSEFSPRSPDYAQCQAKPNSSAPVLLLDSEGKVEFQTDEARALISMLNGAVDFNIRLGPSLLRAKSQGRSLSVLRHPHTWLYAHVHWDAPNRRYLVVLEPTTPHSKEHVLGALTASKLSPREQQVAVLVSQGLTNKEIAKELRLSVDTIKEYLTNTYRKTQTHNRASLTRYLLGSPQKGG